MKRKNKNIPLRNVVSSVLLQLVTIISGFIIPKIILSVFSSEVNGLVSSLNQFLNYISLLEGGLAGVVMANLYQPLAQSDHNKMSSIVKTTKNFYHRISIIFIIYTIFLSIIYPLVVKTSFSFSYVFTLSIILSITLFVQYNFSLALRLLLQADKKVYIVSFTQTVLTICNIILFYILSKFFPNIHFLKLVSAIIFLLQPIIYNIYINKHYKLDKEAKEDDSLTKSRWDGLAINVAAFIHNSTDIAILTIFTNLKIVSVYSIYSLVTMGLKKVITSISAGINPSIGHLYAKGDKKALNEKFELYEFIIFFITFFIFTVGGLLITDFVLLYTRNITDINYNEPIFGILIILAEMIFCLREPYVSIAYTANKFKDMKKAAYLEAIINIIVSIILVRNFGLIGVAVGTILSLLYRTLYHVVYLKDHILNRNILEFVKKILLFATLSMIGIIICNRCFTNTINTALDFIKSGMIYSTIIITLYLIGCMIFYRKDLEDCKKMIIKK